ncbi:DASH complex subunit ASK1 [Entomortierella parvispora]|uniref:DASH complex subunit ASK1 n=1 Tax=Entomortierella parvispora TaxID=205924 RepID=A0A9P3HJK0_9FUNG|nr:DASH complex subunit ASK1 [Entomortierella parvispora]
MSNQPISTADALDEIERLEQSITRTLQEIDQSFSDCQSIVSSKILPQIDRYSESSMDVWKHAHLWLNFFEAALAPPSAPTAADGGGRHFQAAKDASVKSKERLQQMQQRREEQEQQEQRSGFNSAIEESQMHGTNQSPHRRQQHRLSYMSLDELSEDNSTNRQRIGSVNLESPRFSSHFLDSSPLASLPSTPLRNQGRMSGTAHSPLAAAGRSNAPSTPQRAHNPFDSSSPINARGSTTPRITLKDRPMAFPTYTRVASSSNTGAGQPAPMASTPRKNSTSGHAEHGYSPMRGTLDGGFLELDVNEDHQDVITPPSTLHFSIPESKIPGTPRSVLAKSLVDKINLRDGHVIPQPIFVGDDEDEDVVEDERASNRASIGGSKKRSRDGDLLEDHYDHGQDGDVFKDSTMGKSPRRTNNSARWASLTTEQRNTERLLKSPRKISSVQDFFNPTASSSQEPESQHRSPSPSLQIMSQIMSQSAEDPEPLADEEDSLLARLKTPPGFRAIKDRYSILPTSHQSTRTTAAPLKPTLAPTSSTATTTSGISSSSTATSTAAISRTTSSMHAPPVPVAITKAASSTGPVVTPVPINNNLGTASSGTGSASSIGSIFRDSFSSGLAASSAARRQTMATAGAGSGSSSVVGSSKGPFNNRTSIGSGFKLPSSQHRQSFGPTTPSLGNLRPATLSASGASSTAAAVDAVGLAKTLTKPASVPPANSRLSLIGSSSAMMTPVNSRLSLGGNHSTAALRKPLYPTSPSPASRAAATAVVATAASSSSAAGEGPSSSRAPRESAPSAAIDTTPVTGAAANVVHTTMNMSRLSSGARRQSASRAESMFSPSRGGFTTPTFSDRTPPPAPRLGYHSDTLMTQSSLGLNHDGLYGHRSQTGGSNDDRTGMTGLSTSPGGRQGSARTETSDGGSLPFTASTMTSTTTTTTSTRATAAVVTASRRTTYPKTSGLGSTTLRSFQDRVRASEIEENTSFGDEGDHLENHLDDDEDVTQNMMRSPCPPGRTLPFMGSKTDLKSVAAATAAASSANGSSSSSGGGGSLGSLFGSVQRPPFL